MINENELISQVDLPWEFSYDIFGLQVAYLYLAEKHRIFCDMFAGHFLEQIMSTVYPIWLPRKVVTPEEIKKLFKINVTLKNFK